MLLTNRQILLRTKPRFTKGVMTLILWHFIGSRSNNTVANRIVLTYNNIGQTGKSILLYQSVSYLLIQNVMLDFQLYNVQVLQDAAYCNGITVHHKYQLR